MSFSFIYPSTARGLINLNSMGKNFKDLSEDERFFVVFSAREQDHMLMCVGQRLACGWGILYILKSTLIFY